MKSLKKFLKEAKKYREAHGFSDSFSRDYSKAVDREQNDSEHQRLYKEVL